MLLRESATESRQRKGSALAELLVFGHGALHLFASGVGGGTDALHAQLEIVGIGCAAEGFLKADEVARIEIVERLVEGLHAVLAGAGCNGVVDPARLFRIYDSIA